METFKDSKIVKIEKILNNTINLISSNSLLFSDLKGTNKLDVKVGESEFWIYIKECSIYYVKSYFDGISDYVDSAIKIADKATGIRLFNLEKSDISELIDSFRDFKNETLL